MSAKAVGPFYGLLIEGQGNEHGTCRGARFRSAACSKFCPAPGAVPFGLRDTARVGPAISAGKRLVVISLKWAQCADPFGGGLRI